MPDLTHFDVIDGNGNTIRYLFQDDVTYNAINGLIDRAATDYNTIGNWTLGAINPQTGDIETSTTHAFTGAYVNNAALKITIPSTYKISVFGFTNSNYEGCFTGLSFDNTITYFTDTCYLYNVPPSTSVIIDICKIDSTDITANDLQYIGSNVLEYAIPATTPT